MSDFPYRLICFDVDGTLVGKTVFVWQTLHDRLGTDAVKRRQAYEDFSSGKISYGQWFDHDLELFREQGEVTRQRLLGAIAELELNPGAVEVLCRLKSAGLRLAVVSGSLNIVLEKLGILSYFDDVFINELFFGRDGRLVGTRPTPFDMDNKAGALDWLVAKHDLELSQTVFIGDNFNDVSIARRAGLAIAVGSTCEELIACSAVNIESDDLRALLPLILGG